MVFGSTLVAVLKRPNNDIHNGKTTQKKITNEYTKLQIIQSVTRMFEAKNSRDPLDITCGFGVNNERELC